MSWALTRTYDSAGGEVRWDRMGSGPPLVLLHGTPFSSYVWRRVAPVLARDWTVHVWDMLGYGASEQREGQDVSLAAQGRLFAELLDHWQLDAPAVVAHDFGGAVSLRARLLEGRRYRCLALVDPVALAPWGSPFFALVREHADVFMRLPAYIHHAVLSAYLADAAHRPLPADTLEALVAPWLGEEGQRAFYRQIAQADQRATDEIQPRYGELDLPVLVAWGREDGWIPVAKAHELSAAIPARGSRCSTAPGTSCRRTRPRRCSSCSRRSCGT